MRGTQICLLILQQACLSTQAESLGILLWLGLGPCVCAQGAMWGRSIKTAEDQQARKANGLKGAHGSLRH